MRQENLAGCSVVWNTERPSSGEGEGDGRALAELECVHNRDAKVPIMDPDNNNKQQQQVLLWKRASRLRTAGVRASAVWRAWG